MNLIEVFRDKARLLSKNFSREKLREEVFSTSEWSVIPSKEKKFSDYMSINIIGSRSEKPNACLEKLPNGNFDYVGPYKTKSHLVDNRSAKKPKADSSRSYPKQGADDHPYGHIIKYASNISSNEQIPGLCRFLEGEYDCIAGFIRKLFQLECLDPIPVILKKETPCETFENSDDFISRKIKEAVDKQGRNITEEAILKIMKKRTVTFPVLGRYFPRSDENDSCEHIEIYYLNTNCSCENEYFATLSGVLAHEFAHHAHWSMLKKIHASSAFYEKTWNARAVKESIADFSCFLWLVSSDKSNGKAKNAEKLYNSWEEWLGSSWPYAEAMRYFYVNMTWCSPKFYGFEARFSKVPDYYEEMLKKLRQVIFISTDMNIAYNELRL